METTRSLTSQCIVVCVDNNPNTFATFPSRDAFNHFRVQMYYAVLHTFEHDRSPDSQHVAKLLRPWVQKNSICFDTLPKVCDETQMQIVRNYSLTGLYWFLNHSDRRGTLSLGQVYDLTITVNAYDSLQTCIMKLSPDFSQVLNGCMHNLSLMKFDMTTHLADSDVSQALDDISNAMRRNPKE